MVALFRSSAFVESALAVALMVAPAAIAWATGQKLLRLRDDAALPERLEARRLRIVQAVIIAMVALGFLKRNVALTLVFTVLTVAVVDYPFRKRLFGERWRLGDYLVFFGRFWVALLGFWIGVAAAPPVIIAAIGAKWPLAFSLAVVLLLWNARYGDIFLRLLRATPLVPSALFTAIIQKSKTGAVNLFRFGAPGGTVPFAFALPGRGIVVFGDTALEALDPDEQAAIFAHEVAHLEFYDRRRLRYAAIVVWALTITCTFGAALLPASMSWVAYAWSPAIIVLFLAALARNQKHEELSDRRAVELCGDPEALVRALTKLTALARQPRRLAPDTERAASHPSLAHRIQLIRGRGPDAGPAITSPVLIPTKTTGAFVIFEPERVHWITGASGDGRPDAPRVLATASGCRSAAYTELVELRLKIGIFRGASLRAMDRHGKSWSVPIPSEAVKEMQVVLDAVDERLGPLPGHQLPQFSRVSVQITAALMVLLGSVLRTTTLTPILAGLIGIVRPGRAAMGGIAGIALTCGVLEIAFNVDRSSVGTLTGVVASAVSGVAAFAVFPRDRMLPDRRFDVALMIAVWLIVIWSGLGHFLPTRDASTAPAAIPAILMSVPKPIMRLLGAVLFVAYLYWLLSGGLFI